MIQCCAVALTLAVCGVGEEGLTVSARLNAEKLKVGRTYEIELSYELSAGLAAAGISSPILQIQTPKSVKLTGKTLKSHGELAGNEYLYAPYERLLEESPATIEFKLRKRPKSGDVIGLSVIAYVSGSDGESSRFVRRRLVLPLEAGATATEGSADASDWGKGDFLQIGDQAEPFELPRADGSTLSLGEYLGKKNVLVTTYRAFW